MSYVRWLPTGSQELQAFAVRELDFRLSRLERQRADMLQRIAAKDETEYHAHATNSTTWTWDDGVAPSLEVEFEVPTEKAWVQLDMGWERVHVMPSFPGIYLVDASPTLKIDGVTVTNIYTHDISEVFMTTQATKNYRWMNALQDNQSYDLLTMRTLSLAPGTHTARLEIGLSAPGTLAPGSDVYVRNLAFRGYVHA